MNTIDILSVPVSQTNYNSLLNKIRKIIDNNKSAYICVAAVHLVMECQKNHHLLEGVKSADVVTPDGMPLVWLSKLYGGKNTSRVYGPDLTLVLCKLAEKYNHKVFFLGGSLGQSKKLVKILRKRFPKLKIAGNIDTPTRPISKKENQNIIKEINQTKPDIVFVGLGCPLQELWMIENRKKLSPLVLVGVGAAFDFISHNVKQAPSWIQNIGLEWLFRLIQEPRRLFKRYLILNTLFLFKISKQILSDFLNGKI